MVIFDNKNALYSILVSAVCFSSLSSSPSHAFDKLFGPKLPPHKKLSLLSLESLEKIPHEELTSNCVFVSPTTFKFFFSNQEESFGYLRLFNEYKLNKEDSFVSSLLNVQGFFCAKPLEGIPDQAIAMTEDFKKLIFKIEFKGSSKTNDIVFMKLEDSLESAGYAKFNLQIKHTLSGKQELLGKALNYQFLKRFENIPLSTGMDKIPFVISGKDLPPSLSISEIRATLTSPPTSKRLARGTHVTFTLIDTPLITINTYKEPQNLELDSLMLKVEPRRRLLQESEKIEVVKLEDFIKENIVPEKSPMIKNLNFNFKALGIGGQDKNLEELLRRGVISRAVPQEALEKLGIKDHTKGILLYGPPGTGKSLIASKISEMLGVKEGNFIAIDGPEVLSKFVGQSEENIRNLFSRAERFPNDLIVIFFDEFDSIGKTRSDGTGTGENVANNIVNQLLSKMDGVKNKYTNVLVIAATNRIEAIDRALLRPGRFEVQLHIGLPDALGRRDIFDIYLQEAKEKKALQNINMDLLVEKTQNYSGAEIKGICSEAKKFALQDNTEDSNDLSSVNVEKLTITMEHFLAALNVIRPQFGQNFSMLESQFPKHTMTLAAQEELLKKIQFKLTSHLCGKVSSVLITGEEGTGKSSLAGLLVDKTKGEFDLTRVINANLLKDSFATQLKQLWQDSLSVKKSLIVLDGLEDLLKIVNQYKYDDHAVSMLNTLLGSKTTNQVTVVATLGSNNYQLLQGISPNTKWSMKVSTQSLKEKDVEELVKNTGIPHKEINTLLHDISISKALEILNIKEPQRLTMEEWQDRAERILN